MACLVRVPVLDEVRWERVEELSEDLAILTRGRHPERIGRIGERVSDKTVLVCARLILVWVRRGAHKGCDFAIAAVRYLWLNKTQMLWGLFINGDTQACCGSLPLYS